MAAIVATALWRPGSRRWLRCSATSGPATTTRRSRSPPFQPSIAWGECPTDIEVTFTARHECGVLTVLVDRADPSKGTLELTRRPGLAAGRCGPGPLRLHLRQRHRQLRRDPRWDDGQRRQPGHRRRQARVREAPARGPSRPCSAQRSSRSRRCSPARRPGDTGAEAVFLDAVGSCGDAAAGPRASTRSTTTSRRRSRTPTTCAGRSASTVGGDVELWHSVAVPLRGHARVPRDTRDDVRRLALAGRHQRAGRRRRR